MNDMSNTPVMPAGSKPFFQVWMDALTKPNEATFAEIAASPNAKATTAMLWLFIGYLVEFFLASLVQSAAMSSLLQRYGGSNVGAGSSGFIGRIVTAVCGAPIAALIGTLLFAVMVAIIQWIAKMFGGKGTFDQMFYTFAAILTPFMIVSGVVSLLAAIPFVGLCFSILLLLAGIYVFVLEVMAVKGVNQFGWGPAIGALLIPSLVIGFVCGCLVIGSLMALGPVIGNAFSTINQSLQSVP